jgi:hypothetical protein
MSERATHIALVTGAVALGVAALGLSWLLERLDRR